MFGTVHDATLFKAARDRKDVSEWQELGSIKAIFDDINDMLEKMKKDKRVRRGWWNRTDHCNVPIVYIAN